MIPPNNRGHLILDGRRATQLVAVNVLLLTSNGTVICTQHFVPYKSRTPYIAIRVSFFNPTIHGGIFNKIITKFSIFFPVCVYVWEK